MLPAEGSEVLRVAVLSAVIGFAGFCISYGVYVWRKRNVINRPPRSLPIKLAQMFFLLGGATIALAWVFNEFQGRIGIAGGSDVFVVKARLESFAQHITRADTVTRGDVVAEFFSPADLARISGIDLQIAQAKAKKEAIAHKVLQYDEALLQKQTHLRSELLQNKGFAFELQKWRYEVEREQATLTTEWTREEGKLLEDLAEAQRELAAARDRREITQRALLRGKALEKQGNVSIQQLDSRSADDLSAELGVEKNEQAIASLKQQHAALTPRYASTLASLDRQISDLSAEHARMAATIVDLEGRIETESRRLRADHDRAVVSRQGEVDAVNYDITILAAEKRRLTELGQVRAPFSGKVVYRNPAPGLASANSPLVAISAGTGFNAAIRLPRGELRELAAQTNPVELALDTPLLNRYFTGRFVRSEPVPFEPERVIAYFACNLPPEIVGYLGNSADPLRVRLLWRPSLLLQPGAEFAILLFAVGFLSLAVGARNIALPSRDPRRDGGTRASIAPARGRLAVLSAATRRGSLERGG
jgi:hypothetical protein